MGTAVEKLLNSARNISTKQFKNEQDFYLSTDILHLKSAHEREYSIENVVQNPYSKIFIKFGAHKLLEIYSGWILRGKF